MITASRLVSQAHKWYQRKYADPGEEKVDVYGKRWILVVGIGSGILCYGLIVYFVMNSKFSDESIGANAGEHSMESILMEGLPPLLFDSA